ncbi:unnamed protein product [Dovyalis caffra]|uniref:DUF4283 domain-containing protein n=1 Tax=Dovyalis caffra TaxID=77055 RepID=A0AAV1RKZ1_9ROSI|nr:unnamed protein product [Dovyalis caffra]
MPRKNNSDVEVFEGEEEEEDGCKIVEWSGVDEDRRMLIWINLPFHIFNKPRIGLQDLFATLPTEKKLGCSFPLFLQRTGILFLPLEGLFSCNPS